MIPVISVELDVWGANVASFPSMKRSLLYVLPVVIAAAFGVFYFKERDRGPEPAAADGRSERGLAGGLKPVNPGGEKRDDAGLAKRNAALEAELAQERARRTVAEDAIKDLDGEIVVSLGKVGDVGKRIGGMLADQAEWRALRAKPEGDRTPEESRRLLQLERDRAEALGTLSEVAEFQNNPAEYGEFFKGVFQQAAGLSDAEAANVETYMRSRADLMVQKGLNEAREPDDPEAEEVWEGQRDAFNEETTDGLKKQLPSGTADTLGLDDSLLELLEGDFDKATALTR